MAKNKNGLIIWEGKSQLDGAPIVLLATNVINASQNQKTGDMIQTYILRSDIAPNEALKNGGDKSVCGDCPFSGGNGCYVNVGKAPLQVWKTYKNGRYPYVNRDNVHLLNRKPMRVGAYGDPTAVPRFVWFNLLKDNGFTGYTHQWKKLGKEWQFLMASADTPEQAEEANSMGWRAFTISQELPENHIWCPATPEGGNKVNCVNCKLCSGNKVAAKNIAVRPHGASWKVQRMLKKLDEINLQD